MRYGKIRIENDAVCFSSHRRQSAILLSDIVWAYHGRDLEGQGRDRRIVSNCLMVITRRGRTFQFPMSEQEAVDCLKLLKILQPSIATSYPEGVRLTFQSLSNARDLGGLEAMDGRRILPSRFLRSGELYHLSRKDRQLLETDCMVKTVIDLRSTAERRSRPDDPLSFAEHYHIPLLDESSYGFFQEVSITDIITSIAGDPQTYIKEQYRKMIADAYTVGQIARVLELVRANQSGAILVHDAMGKDRVDLITMSFLSVLGIPRETIREEYMKSNAALQQEKQYAMELMDARGFDRHRMESRIHAIYEVKVNYLDAVFYAIETKYGSVSDFLRKGLYLTTKAIDDMRDKYLV